MGLLGRKKAPDWVYACELADFSISRKIVVGRAEYCVYKLADGVYCTQESCSHEYSPLSQGIVMNDEVFCEKHGSRFNIKTGAVINLPATEPIKTYNTKVEEGKVYIFVPAP